MGCPDCDPGIEGRQSSLFAVRRIDRANTAVGEGADKWCRGAVIAMLEKLTDQHLDYAAFPVFAAIAPRLDQPQLSRAANALTAIMEKSEDVPWGFVGAEEQLIALAPRLEPARSTHVSDFLLCDPGEIEHSG